MTDSLDEDKDLEKVQIISREVPEYIQNLSHPERKWLYEWPQDKFARFLESHRRCRRVFLYLRGPRPRLVENRLHRRILPWVEDYFDRVFLCISSRREFITPLFLLAWLLAFTFLVRASSFMANTSEGVPETVVSTSSYWDKNAGCGLDGEDCGPFNDSSLIFRCPSRTTGTQLLNTYMVGDQSLDFQPLVVGGFDANATYRADSWICASAVQQGLFSNVRGGCGRLTKVGAFADFVGGKQHGVESVDFPSEFPSSYRFDGALEQHYCKDLQPEITGFNVAMTVVYSFIIRPAPKPFFWALFCFGFWHVVLVSDPTDNPPDVSTGFKYFLPALFFGLAFYAYSFRYVLPAFEGAVLERTVFYLAGFWMGLLVNQSLEWIPIDRLTASDIHKEPGGLVAVIVVMLFLFVCVLIQLYTIRRTGWLFYYVKWYAVGGIVTGILAALPDLELRVHHYVAAMVLIPGVAFVTRPSAIFQGFLLGMFLDGAARWGFDSILQTAAELVGDATVGSSLPSFTDFNFSSNTIEWNAISDDSSYNAFGLLVDDVLRYLGSNTSYTLSGLNSSLVHYLRLAYYDTSSSSYGDFTEPALVYLSNSTYIAPGAGAT